MSTFTPYCPVCAEHGVRVALVREPVLIAELADYDHVMGCPVPSVGTMDYLEWDMRHGNEPAAFLPDDPRIVAQRVAFERVELSAVADEATTRARSRL
ncbi:hypothetical protein [Burkholderia cenocepacia]|uniref:hypothetical protein n=1 Tax=Burkholderia cenocepacia TaxID=95486 RepID=UPI002AB6C748|nr:hypothetical protein [Burkholderia cenocepacia]